MSANGESSSKVVRSEEEYRRWIQKFSDANDHDAVPLSSDRILLFNSRPRLESLNWGGFCLTNYLMLFFPFFLFSVTEVSFRSFVSDTSILEIRRAKPEFLGDTNTPSISSHYYTNWVRLAIILCLSTCLLVCPSVSTPLSMHVFVTGLLAGVRSGGTYFLDWRRRFFFGLVRRIAYLKCAVTVFGTGSNTDRAGEFKRYRVPFYSVWKS